MRLPHSGNVTTPQRPLGKATLIATGASVAPSMAAFICIGGPKKDLFLEPTNNLGTTEPVFGSGSIYLYIHTMIDSSTSEIHSEIIQTINATTSNNSHK